MLLFLTDQHWEVFRALLASYSALPISARFSIESGMTQLSMRVGDAFVLALQISSPFVIYGMIINLLFGLANKLIPQIPVYFISMPFVIAGGFLLLYFTIAGIPDAVHGRLHGLARAGVSRHASSRAKKIQRIVKAQAQLKLAEEWRLRGLTARLAEIEAGERELIAALGADNALHGLFLDATARRLRAVAEDAARIREAKDAAIAQAAGAATRLKTAERLSEDGRAARRSATSRRKSFSI